MVQRFIDALLGRQPEQARVWVLDRLEDGRRVFGHGLDDGRRLLTERLEDGRKLLDQGLKSGRKEVDHRVDDGRRYVNDRFDEGRRQSRAWFISAAPAVELGTAGTNDLVDAVRAYFTARYSHLQAIHDLNTALANLERASAMRITDRWENACD